MKKIIKRLLPETFKRRIKEDLGVPSLHWSLQNLKRIGFHPSFVIDGGAYEGYWTKDFLEVFPHAKILMLEAQLKKEAILKSVCNDHPGVAYHMALLSDEDGKVLSFAEDETASHVLLSDKDGSKRIVSETLDCIIERGNFPLPDFIKLDIQGFELEVLKGSSHCLCNAEFCLLEVSFLDLGGGTPLLVDVSNFMADRGFQAYDICQFIRRPYDNAMWQVDMLFIKTSSRFIQVTSWA